MKTEEEIRNELASIIKYDPNNYSRILSLSNELAKFDKDNVRFSVDAGIINRLGVELVGKRETAVSELIKNAYDADAYKVELIFKDAYNVGGQLQIIDTGDGMTRDQLINGFMRLSSSDKIHNPISKKYKRQKAGKKGIGRFATQRLGSKLTIITQTKESTNSLKVIIDWNKFEIDQDISNINNQIIEIPKEREQGTELIIDNLREGWSDAIINKIYRHISSLLQPFPLSKKQTNGKEIDPGFLVSLYRDKISSENLIVDETEAFYNHALATIDGFVDNGGKGFWKVSSSKLDFIRDEYLRIGKKSKDETSPFLYLKEIYFRAYYFIYDSSLLPPQTLTYIRETANESGGIRLYRNGFRVLPYGERGNDWLGLDASVRRRTIIAPHQNQSFFGFIEIDSDDSNLFEETSSREGLIENDAYDELIDYVYRVIINAVVKIAELRERKGAAAQKDWEKKEKPTIIVDKAIVDLKDIIEEESFNESDDSENENYDNEDYRKKEQERKDYNKKAKILIETIIEGREREKKEKQDLIDENNMLRILAGLGLVIGEFVHEVKRFLPGFDAEISYLKRVMADKPEVLPRIALLDKNLKSFASYTSYFDDTISRNVFRELEPINIKIVVNDFIDVIQNDLQRSHIEIMEPFYEDFDIITLPMHPSEWASILFNFYTNSKKAIKKRDIAGKILIRSGVNNGIVYFEFSDNGIGIPKENRDLVFDAFFTTTSVGGQDTKDIEINTGTGLGLKIVKDIIESYNGVIYVTNPISNFSTTIRIELPINNDSNE